MSLICCIMLPSLIVNTINITFIILSYFFYSHSDSLAIKKKSSACVYKWQKLPLTLFFFLNGGHLPTSWNTRFCPVKKRFQRYLGGQFFSAFVRQQEVRNCWPFQNNFWLSSAQTRAQEYIKTQTTRSSTIKKITGYVYISNKTKILPVILLKGCHDREKILKNSMQKFKKTYCRSIIQNKLRKKRGYSTWKLLANS